MIKGTVRRDLIAVNREETNTYSDTTLGPSEFSPESPFQCDKK
jgi:hypothetical protein